MRALLVLFAVTLAVWARPTAPPGAVWKLAAWHEGGKIYVQSGADRITLRGDSAPVIARRDDEAAMVAYLDRGKLAGAVFAADGALLHTFDTGLVADELCPSTKRDGPLAKIGFRRGDQVTVAILTYDGMVWGRTEPVRGGRCALADAWPYSALAVERDGTLHLEIYDIDGSRRWATDLRDVRDWRPRLVALETSFALVYRRPWGEPRLARFNKYDGVIEDVAIDGDLDYTTLDLGHTDFHTFVTFRRGTRVVVRSVGYAPAQRIFVLRGGDPAAVVNESACGAAVRTDEGVEYAMVDPCP